MPTGNYIKPWVVYERAIHSVCPDEEGCVWVDVVENEVTKVGIVCTSDYFM